MTKLEQAIETLKSLPAEDQDFYADWVLAEVSGNDTLQLTKAELEEIDRRIASDEPAVPGEQVFARLRKKYGSV
jgi:hypothetical protein